MSATTAREALDAYMVHESDDDAAEFARRVEAVVNEALGVVPDFFQPDRTYARRDGCTFQCFAITTHPDGGRRLAIGWLTDTADWTFLAQQNLGQWLHEYDCTEPPAEVAVSDEEAR